MRRPSIAHSMAHSMEMRGILLRDGDCPFLSEAPRIIEISLSRLRLPPRGLFHYLEEFTDPFVLSPDRQKPPRSSGS